MPHNPDSAALLQSSTAYATDASQDEDVARMPSASPRKTTVPLNKNWVARINDAAWFGICTYRMSKIAANDVKPAAAALTSSPIPEPRKNPMK
jgi:hypothetical protein